MPLLISPAAFLMAPDGLTAYVIGDGTIVYYDVLSGTADLSASFPAGNSYPFIHPDGNRIFTLQTFPTSALSVFDVAQRKVINQFPIKFAAGVAMKLEMAQNGATLTVLSNKNEVQTLDALTGQVMDSATVNVGTSYAFSVPVLQWCILAGAGEAAPVSVPVK